MKEEIKKLIELDGNCYEKKDNKWSIESREIMDIISRINILDTLKEITIYFDKISGFKLSGLNFIEKKGNYKERNKDEIISIVSITNEHNISVKLYIGENILLKYDIDKFKIVAYKDKNEVYISIEMIWNNEENRIVVDFVVDLDLT